MSSKDNSSSHISRWQLIKNGEPYVEMEVSHRMRNAYALVRAEESWAEEMRSNNIDLDFHEQDAESEYPGHVTERFQVGDVEEFEDIHDCISKGELTTDESWDYCESLRSNLEENPDWLKDNKEWQLVQGFHSYCLDAPLDVSEADQL